MIETMNRTVVTVILIFVLSGIAAGQENLSDHLAPFKPLLGKTWKGKFVNSNSEEPRIDIMRWERALNGMAIRILPSINQGEYGGETIMMWDPEKESLVHFYFTTAGFYTQGTTKFEDRKFIHHEYVTDNENGITEVKSVGELRPDGTYHGKSQYLKNGEWVDGHEVIYEEAPEAEVVFK